MDFTVWKLDFKVKKFKTTLRSGDHSVTNQNLKSLYTISFYQVAACQSFFNLNIHLKKQERKNTPQNQKQTKKSSTLRSHLTADWKGLKSWIKIDEAGTSLAVQWLGLCTSTAAGPGFNSRSRSWDPTGCVARPKTPTPQTS